MTNIKDELKAAAPGQAPILAIALQAKVLTLAVELGIDKEVPTAFVERAALAVIAARYFRMIEDDRWATWLAEQG